MSSWNALVGEVNNAIAGMNAQASAANSAATLAQEAANAAADAAETAVDAAESALDEAEAAAKERAKWEGATASIRTLEPDEDATLTMSDAGGVKNLAFAVPRGIQGRDGEKGAAGESGVSFTLTGTSLYIRRL